MISTNDVYGKIKEMSTRVVHPRPQIAIKALAAELLLAREQILPSIIELKNLRLIQWDGSAHSSVHIRLTLLGHTVIR
jgi:hypothetical protein